MHKYALVTAIAIVLCAAPVSAAGPRKTTGRITGSVTASALTAGACAAVGTDAYDSMCPSGDAAGCKCLSVSGFALSGGFGSGTASLSATADYSATVVTGSSTGSCAPAFAVVTLSIKAKGKNPASTQTLNALAAICGTPATTPVSVLGGFTIEGSTSTAPASGSGIFNGTVSTVGAVSITLTGLITNP